MSSIDGKFIEKRIPKTKTNYKEKCKYLLPCGFCAFTGKPCYNKSTKLCNKYFDSSDWME